MKKELENEINLYIEKKNKKKYKKIINEVINNKSFYNKPKEERLLDICILGSSLKQEIEEKEKQQFCEFINIKQEIANNNRGNSFVLPLYLLSDMLIKNGCKVAIERKANNFNLNNLCIQQIFSQEAFEKKFTITFENKSDLLFNDNKRNTFFNAMKNELWQIFHISKKDIFFLNPRGPGFTIDLYISGIDERTQNNIYNYIRNRKDIITIMSSILMEGCKLSFDLFEPEFNMRPNDWPGVPGMRGGFKYFPPSEYYGFGLKVKGNYDNGDDTWLGHINIAGEFAVAYHGIRHNNPLWVVNRVVYSHLENGQNNTYENDEDEIHPGQRCGKGVYVTPLIGVAEGYTKEVYISQLNKKYRIAFQCRVNPKKIRQPRTQPDYWILNGNGEEIRPYRLLIKEC